MKKRLILILLFFGFYTSTKAQIDSIWQVYYDSTDTYWKIDWFKTEQLLSDAKVFLENNQKDYKNDSIYNLTLNDIGLCYVYLGRYEEALSTLSEALENTKISLGKDHSEYGVRLNSLAFVYITMGNYEKALSFYLKAFKNIEQTLGKDHFFYGSNLNSLAGLYELMGRYEESLPLHLEALENVKESLGEKHSEYGLHLNNIAGLYESMGDYDKALPFYLKALENTENSLGKESPSYGIRLNNLAFLYTKKRHYDKALALLLEALKNTENSLGKEHSVYGIRLNNLAILYSKMGRHKEALQLYQQALNNFEKNLGKEHSRYGKSLNNLAALYESMGWYEKALPLFIEANVNFNRQIEKVFVISNEKNKKDFLNTLGENFHQYHSFAYTTQYQLDSMNMMLYNNELIHKSLILNSTKKMYKDIKENGNKELLFNYKLWQNLKNDIAQQYSQPITNRSTKLDSLERFANQLEEELVRKSSSFASFRKQVNWQEVKNVLKQGEIAIEFVHFRYQNKEVTDSIIYAAMLVTFESESPTIIPLFEEKELNRLLERDKYLDELTYINQLYQSKNEENLYRLIWSKLEEVLDGTETVYFVPSGLLHQISFNAIETPNGKLLGQQLNLLQLNSTRQLVIPAETPQLASIVLFGGIQYAYHKTGLQNEENEAPLFALNTIAGYEKENDLTRSGFQFLPGSLAEVNQIGSLLKKSIQYSILKANDATEASFKALSGNSPKVLHISTHGFFFPDIEKTKEELNRNEHQFKYDENPLFRSGLTFAGSDYAWQKGYNPYEEEDGILTAYEIANLDLSNTDLVVLSACNTGLGEIKGSEGVYGLQRAFKMAGVENLIMSLWKVPDKQTVELMELFYANWMKGYDIRTAFDKAQASMSEQYPPYYWAAFVLVGDVVATKKPTSKTIWWFGGLGLLSIVVLGVWGARRKNAMASAA